MMPNDSELLDTYNEDGLRKALCLSHETWSYFVGCAIAKDRDVSYMIKQVLEAHAAAEFEIARELLRVHALPPVAAKPRRKAIASKVAWDVFDRDGGVCHYCEEELPRNADWHIDHKTPVVKGGSNDSVNLVLSCAKCNIEKSDKDYELFVSSIGRPAK